MAVTTRPSNPQQTFPLRALPSDAQGCPQELFFSFC